MTLTIAMAILLLVASVPYWLPRAVVALRMHIFTRINGDEGIPIPGKLVDASRFKQVYSDRAADGRSRGAALSDLFWYWLSPGPEIHQEHIEPGERYDEVARTTHQILAVPKHTAEDLTRRVVGQIMDEHDIRSATVVRLRDLMMPIWADVYYEVVFGKPCNPAARKLIVDNASDVVTALKCCSLRHMGRRHQLTSFLIEKVRGGEVPHALPACLSTEEKALYLQGVFFNTAVVQMSEAMTHLMLVIAQHDGVQARLTADPENDDYIHGVINEGFRIFPLFGISHRITSGDITVSEQTTIPRGSVLCFNHQEFHRQSFDDPERFDPERWASLSAHEANFIPFGVAANRACPAQAMALVTMRVAACELLRRVRFRSSVIHTRSIPNRGPCLVIPRAIDYNLRLERAQLFWMRLRDRWEDVGRSIVQLVLGTYMVWDARRLRLCQRYFEAKDSEDDKNPEPKHHASACPFAPRSTARTIEADPEQKEVVVTDQKMQVFELILAIAQRFWSSLRAWMRHMWPIFTAGILLVGVWDVITSEFRLLPLPYFPGPASVLRNLISDRALLLDSTWHSLALLLSGYTLGVIVGLISGVCIGWSSSVRYWGMPLLKVVGPIPATAWIPLAMVVSPSAIVSSAGLVALAVWFPVTMLTASGISNTRASYLDVARTLGAGRAYLIFRVAIPAAIPNIFIGLFMGLGASFLTLVVAESVGVKSGLGWYVTWAQGWAEYGKVFAALIIMAGFFSTLMTLLFKLRDRVLVWQKGIIKW